MNHSHNNVQNNQIEENKSELPINKHRIDETCYLMDTSNDKLFGIIKSIDGDSFSHEKHKSEYDKLCTFVIDYV